MATCAELQTWLGEAESAYHALQLGGQVQQIRSDSGKMLTYTSANMDGLVRYIGSLRARVAACTGVQDANTRSLLRFVPR